MQLKIIVEKHPEGYVAYPLGRTGVIVGEGDTYGSIRGCKSCDQIPHRDL
ncbi:MAG: hypothetical protein SYNGOMJ08_00133 [Candidatus Syntrophoarchaeum sp. GoM_oil]|nr:MAG: hypothetical protein SYNGOMJ08_00133 [Candidatus Syntrophoarchaeum sp. GoM_oil]